jgi:hypothetical protein
MNASPQAKRTPRERLWLAIRFIVFGMGGFVLLITSWFVLFGWFGGPPWMKPLFTLLLALVGAAMMLFGSGRWGRWAYLWVFLSMPMTVSVLMFVFPNPAPDAVSPMWETPFAQLWFAAPMPITYFFVKRYYRIRDAHANP